MSEKDERLVPRGQQGERGEQGEQGAQGKQGTAGLSSPVRRALVSMFALFILLAAANFLWSARAQNAYEANLRKEHAVHERATVLVIDKLCLTFGTLGALKPPPGPAATNPSRAYEDRLHATLIQLGADLGCK